MKTRKTASTSNLPDAATRLKKLLHAKGAIPYHENLPDKEFPSVTCSIYGAPETNELFVKLTNGNESFVEAIQSGLLHPCMADRIFGMDVMDSNDAFGLADQMWKKHRAALLSTKPVAARD